MALGGMGGDEGLVLRTKGPPGGLQHQRLGCGGRRRLEIWGPDPYLAGKEWHFHEAGITHDDRFLGMDGASGHVRRKSSLEFVKSRAGIGVEAAELSVTTNLCCSCPKLPILQFYPNTRWL